MVTYNKPLGSPFTQACSSFRLAKDCTDKKTPKVPSREGIAGETAIKLMHKEIGICIELYTTVLPAVFLALVFCRYQIFWRSVFPVGITNLAGTPFFRMKGGLAVSKRGSRQKNDTEMYRPRFPLVLVW